MKTFCLHDYWHPKDFEDSYFNFNIPWCPTISVSALSVYWKTGCQCCYFWVRETHHDFCCFLLLSLNTFQRMSMHGRA